MRRPSVAGCCRTSCRWARPAWWRSAPRRSWPGVTLYRIVRGAVDPDDGYTATADFATTAARPTARGGSRSPRSIRASSTERSAPSWRPARWPAARPPAPSWTGSARWPPSTVASSPSTAAGTSPAHGNDYTCGNAHEPVAFTADFGAALPTGPGYQVRLDAQDRVVEVAPVRGGAEPAAGTVVLQATGDAAAWLAEHGTAGARLVLDTDVVDGDTGRRVPLRPGASVVNGGPLLVEDGATALDPVRDGWSPATLAGTARADFYWRWYVRRNPRTAAGVLPDGRLVFVVVDGRQVGRSVGLSITETAELMRSLGVDEALNLDGGGSSTVVTEDGVVNTPSDPVERPVGDAVVLLPGRP
ncbi:hypothetical protein DY240_25720 [Jiangella rhizosphaerae]|uniref:Phosphodiester glycosidase domain-containing protein n=1 Tax=Jiangella rhizosphaerae TaxID=2293569 RepID=A0A418KIR3_9ACTN|nr:hypothetical protein DY240_25720 [Jiangella rhizosphaerae]